MPFAVNQRVKILATRFDSDGPGEDGKLWSATYMERGIGEYVFGTVKKTLRDGSVSVKWDGDKRCYKSAETHLVGIAESESDDESDDEVINNINNNNNVMWTTLMMMASPATPLMMMHIMKSQWVHLYKWRMHIGNALWAWEKIAELQSRGKR